MRYKTIYKSNSILRRGQLTISQFSCITVSKPKHKAVPIA